MVWVILITVAIYVAAIIGLARIMVGPREDWPCWYGWEDDFE